MKKISKLLLIALGVIALLIVEIVIVKVGSQYEPEVTVIYARTNIPVKTEITDEMLVEKQVSLTYVHKLSVRNKADLIGKKAKNDIEAGEMILTSRIGNINEMQGIPMVNKNNRLFSVEFKPDQVNGWWLLVNQHVDIIFVPNPSAAAAPITNSNPANMISDAEGVNKVTPISVNDEERITTINKSTGIVRINNVRVAAIIDDFYKQMNNSERTGDPKYICFEVSPEQDEFLAWAKKNGSLEISVRPVEE